MTPALSERVAAWFTRVMDHLDRQPGRGVRVAAAGPVPVQHSYQPGTSHADLCDALLGAPGTASPLIVHSLQGPPRHLMSPPPVTQDELAGRVYPAGLSGSRWRLTWNAAEGAVSCWDRLTGHGVYVTAGPVQGWERGAPFRSFLHWRAACEGAALVHAGTIGTRERMGLVVGAGGTGKSSTVLIGLDSGLATCGDDYVWLAPRRDHTDVYAVYGTVKTKSDSPWQPHAISGTPEPLLEGHKRIHWLARSSPSSFLSRARVSATVVLTDATEAVGAPRAIVTTAPSTAFQLPYDMPATLRVLRRTLDGVSRLDIPRDGNPSTVSRALLGALSVNGSRAKEPV